MRWLKNLFKKKKREPIYVDDNYLVQDWRGFVMSQEDHKRVWGFGGYPATHPTNCMCGHCQTATHHYAEVNGYLRITPTLSRRKVYHYINNRGAIRKEADFLPKKVMKVHKLDQHIRKETFVSPPLFPVRFLESVMDLETVRRNRDE